MRGETLAYFLPKWPALLYVLKEGGGLHCSQCSEADKDIGLVGHKSSHSEFFFLVLVVEADARFSHCVQTIALFISWNFKHAFVVGTFWEQSKRSNEVVTDHLYKQSLGGVARHARGEWGGSRVERRGLCTHVIHTKPKQHQRQLRTSFTSTTQTIS